MRKEELLGRNIPTGTNPFSRPISEVSFVMSARLIVVSNRIPSEATPSGGLVVALHEALREKGGIWIGAHPETGPEEPGLIDMGGTQYDKLAFRPRTEILGRGVQPGFHR